MCEYCGCRGIEPIGELMDEHTALVDEAHHVRNDLVAGNPVAAMSWLTDLVATGWVIVDQAHARSPSFLLDQATTPFPS